MLINNFLFLFLFQGWNAFNVLHRTAGLVGALDVGYSNTLNEALASKPKLLFLLGVDNKEVTRDKLPSDCFVIYLGKCFEFSFATKVQWKAEY